MQIYLVYVLTTSYLWYGKNIFKSKMMGGNIFLHMIPNLLNIKKHDLLLII